MRILFVNKYLYMVGGAEKYFFELGKKMESEGHEVAYFGTYDKRNTVFNPYNIYVRNYQNQRVFNPIKLIYNSQSRRKLNKLIRKFKPDLIHLQNYNYQLTPSIIYSCKKDNNVKLIQTIHDSQIACPNHRLYIPSKNEPCFKCVDGDNSNCTKNRCIKDSFFGSKIGEIEANYYQRRNTYQLIDLLISPSQFMMNVIKRKNAHLNIRHLLNYSSYEMDYTIVEKDIDVLYFGRLSAEKGINNIIELANRGIRVTIAGDGPLREEIIENKNITYLGFLDSSQVLNAIKRAKISLYTSTWPENCPISIIESISLGTPVIGANIGGIPELIEEDVTGLLFRSGDSNDLFDKVKTLLDDEEKLEFMQKKCLEHQPLSIDEYYIKFMEILREENIIEKK